MTLRTCSGNPRLANLPTIDPTISKSHWMRALHRPMVQYTPCHRRNLQLCVSSLTRTLLQGSSVLPALPMELQSSLFRRKMALFNFASISEASTEFPRKTDIVRVCALHHSTGSLEDGRGQTSASARVLRLPTIAVRVFKIQTKCGLRKSSEKVPKII